LKSTLGNFTGIRQTLKGFGGSGTLPALPSYFQSDLPVVFRETRIACTEWHKLFQGSKEMKTWND
jgi:hypothetical protein